MSGILATYNVPAAWNLSAQTPDIPFSDVNDVAAALPEWMSEGTSAVRDALFAAVWHAFATYASDQAIYAASQDPAYAQGQDLDFAGKQRSQPRGPGENDTSYAGRVAVDQDVQTPAGIMAAIYAITSPFFASKPYYFELPDDEIYISLATSTAPGFSGLQTNGVAYPAGSDGFYCSSTGMPIDNAIQSSTRQIAARGAGQARDGIVWGLFDNAQTRLPQYEVFGDYTNAFNQWCDVVIGIPAFPRSGTSSADDSWVFLDPTHVVTYYIDQFFGTLTPALIANDALSNAYVFTEATLVGFPALQANEPTVFASRSDPGRVVGAIQQLLSASFPARVTLLLDARMT